VPIAALVGVMFMVVIGTFAWSSFRIMNKIPLTDLFVLILVSVVTVFFDLAVAVIAGVIVSDHSALEAIFNLVEKYEAAGKSIKLKHLSEDCKVLLHKASPKFREVIVEDIDDPRYHLAANPEDFPKPLSEYKL